MPHHRHSITTYHEALDVGEVECGLAGSTGSGLGRRGVFRAPKEAVQEPASLLVRRLSVAVLTHLGTRLCIAIGYERMNVLNR